VLPLPAPTPQQKPSATKPDSWTALDLTGFDLSALDLSGLDLSRGGPLLTFAATTVAGLALLFVLTRRRPSGADPLLAIAPREEVPHVPEPDAAPVTTYVNPMIKQEPPPDEAGIPRWLRPSVRRGRGDVEIRRADWD